MKIKITKLKRMCIFNTRHYGTGSFLQKFLNMKFPYLQQKYREGEYAEALWVLKFGTLDQNKTVKHTATVAQERGMS